MQARGCWAVDALTYNSGNKFVFSTYMDFGVTLHVTCERPDQAVVGFVLHGYDVEETARFVMTSSAAKRVAVTAEALGVSATEAVRI